MNRKDLEDLARGIAPVLREFVARELAPLQKRLDELERRPAVSYCGVWRSTRTYGAGSIVTHAGGLWIATSANGLRPGSDGSGDLWQLIVKSGGAPRS